MIVTVQSDTFLSIFLVLGTAYQSSFFCRLRNSVHFSQGSSYLFLRSFFVGEFLLRWHLHSRALFNIKKLDGTNFPFWKEQIYNVSVQKKKAMPIKLKGIKPKAISEIDWQDLDELARSTIMLTLSKSVYFNVKDMRTNFELWQKLCDLYKKKSATSQVYWLADIVG